MIKTLILALFLCLSGFKAEGSSLSASVNKTSLPLGEAVTLTIKSTQSSNDAPDLSVLSQNFKVYSTSMSKQHYVVNGVAQSSTEWQIDIIPLNSGEQHIPSIKVGSEQTNPVKIVVGHSGGGEQLASGSSKAAISGGTDSIPASKYSIDAQIVNAQQKYYVQQQILYDVVLTDLGGLQSGEPIFNAEPGEWLIKSLGQPQIKMIDHGGEKIRQITFKYALFPQHSGNLEIPEVVFNGFASQPNVSTPKNVINAGGFSISFDMPSIFGIETPISLRVPAKKVSVLPVPQGYSGNWWLPAEKVILKEKWLNPPTNLKVGDAVSREITLIATGVVDTQLPEINFEPSPGLKQYPEKSAKENAVVNGKLTAVQKTLNVYIPEKAGKLVLPKVKVSWFNTQSHTFEAAELPAQEIIVSPGANATADYGAGQLLSESAQLSFPQEEALKAPRIENENVNDPSFGNGKENHTSQKTENLSAFKARLNQLRRLFQPWMIYFLVLSAFAAGVLISALFFMRYRSPKEKPQCETRRYPEYIIQKAYQNDFRSLRDALISWATGYYPEHRIANLKDVANAVDDPEFNAQIEILMAKLYGEKEMGVWNPKVFKDIFSNQLKKAGSSDSENPPLPPLYK